MKRTLFDDAPENAGSPTLVEALEAHSAAHRGTDLGALLAWAKLTLEDYAEALEEKETEYQSLLSDAKKMQTGILAADAAITALGGLVYDAKPVHAWATVPRDYSATANVMGCAHRDPDYLPKNGAIKPMIHTDTRNKNTKDKYAAPREYDYKTYAK